MAQRKSASILDLVAAAEDVEEVLLPVPEWGVDILFRGMSLVGLQALQNVNMQAAAQGDLMQAVRMIAATATNPATKELLFTTEASQTMLAQRNFEVLDRLVREGSMVVLGIDEADTAGKD